MRKLPIFELFDHAFSSLFNHLGFAFKITWPWIVTFTLAALTLPVFSIVTKWGQPVEMIGLSDTLLGRVVRQISLNDGAILSVWLGFLLLIAVLGFSSIAVSWHRYILLDETPEAWGVLRVDAIVWRYFFCMLDITFIYLIVAALGLWLLFSVWWVF